MRLFNTRLDILAATLKDRDGAAHKQAVLDCRATLGRVPTDSFPIRKVWGEVESAWTGPFWVLPTQAKLDFLRLKVAPLLRFVPDVDIAAETFTHKVERLKLQSIQGKTSPDLCDSIAGDVSLLPQYVLEDAGKQPSVQLVVSSGLDRATADELTVVIQELAGEMRNKRRVESAFLQLDLPDYIAGKTYVLIGPKGQPVHVDEYRRRIEQRITDIAEAHPALVAIREGKVPSDDQLVDLERVLHNDLAGGVLQVSGKTVRQAYGLKLDNKRGFLGFARHVLDADAIPDYEAVVTRAFDGHITARNYTGDQIRFLRSVQEVFISKGRLSRADLYDPPLTTFGRNAVDRFFAPSEIDSIVALADQLAA